MLGEKLKTLRKSRKLTQDDIAALFGVSKGSISNWENGRRKPNIEQLQVLANFYNVSMDYFNGSEPTNDTNVEDIIYRVENLISSDQVSAEDKERLYIEIMRLYLLLKEKQ